MHVSTFGISFPQIKTYVNALCREHLVQYCLMFYTNWQSVFFAQQLHKSNFKQIKDFLLCHLKRVLYVSKIYKLITKFNYYTNNSKHQKLGSTNIKKHLWFYILPHKEIKLLTSQALCVNDQTHKYEINIIIKILKQNIYPLHFTTT